MGMTLKLSKTKAINPSTKKMGYRTTVKSNGKADMDSMVKSASKNTTLHPAELRMAFELMLDSIQENLKAGNIVELKGIGNIGFSCSSAWTETAAEQVGVEHKIGVSFFPSKEVNAAVTAAQTSWTTDSEDKADAGTSSGSGSSSSSSGSDIKDGDTIDG